MNHYSIYKNIPLLHNPFRSFWMGGYECTDKLNAFGNRVDFLRVTGHLQLLDNDYRDLAVFGIKTVREGIRWSQVEKQAYQYDWSTVAVMIESGNRNGIQQVWDLCHFGYPDDLSPLHPMFARRFAALCRSFVRFYRSVNPTETLIVTPINEVSFISWLGGDVRGTTPYCTKQGWEVKYGLMRAYIEGIAALKEEDPGIRILTTEPLVNTVPPVNATPEQRRFAAKQHESQFEALEILSGRMCPELNGKPEYLDILGFNFYYNNQWIAGTSHFLPWKNEGQDPRWLPLSHLLAEVYERYNRPIVLSETSHPGEDRNQWINFIANECADVLQKGVPLWGVCWYPIIDRPDWDHMAPWHRSGLWDADLEKMNNNVPERTLHMPTATAFLQSQQMVAEILHAQQQVEPV